MQQRTSFVFSVFLHLGLAVMAVLWQNFGGVKVDLEVPAYTVDLVNIMPGPPPGPIAPGPAIPAAAPSPAAPTMTPNPEVKPEQAAAVPEPPKPEPPKPEPVKEQPKPEPPKPEPVKEQPKPEPKPAKPEPKPDAKAISETKTESKKPEPAKKEPVKPEPSNKDILASALQDIKKEASKDGKSGTQASPQQSAKSDVQNELAALRKSVGGSIYSTGGGGGGGGGGSGSSGLLQVYASIVEQAIKKNWRYPVFGNDSNLVAVVEVRIDAQGQIADVKVLSASERADFDDSAVKAVRETKELPPPPSEAVGTLRINFNLQELNR